MEYELILVRVFVTDFERAVRFYTETLEMPLGFRSDEMGWAQLPLGGSQLALERAAPDDAEAQELVGRFLGVSLEVPGRPHDLRDAQRARRRVSEPAGRAALGRDAHPLPRSRRERAHPAG